MLRRADKETLQRMETVVVAGRPKCTESLSLVEKEGLSFSKLRPRRAEEEEPKASSKEKVATAVVGADYLTLGLRKGMLAAALFEGGAAEARLEVEVVVETEGRMVAEAEDKLDREKDAGVGLAGDTMRGEMTTKSLVGPEPVPGEDTDSDTCGLKQDSHQQQPANDKAEQCKARDAVCQARLPQ